MPQDSKTADKVQKAIKELARLPHNKKCFNCLRDVRLRALFVAGLLSLIGSTLWLQGPQANVCLTFNTFVCSSCAGLQYVLIRFCASFACILPPSHLTQPVSFSREFAHKVKTISMSEFGQAELDGLTQGGNKVSVTVDILLPVLSCRKPPVDAAGGEEGVAARSDSGGADQAIRCGTAQDGQSNMLRSASGWLLVVLTDTCMQEFMTRVYVKKEWCKGGASAAAPAYVCS